MKELLRKIKALLIDITRDNTHLLHLIIGNYLTQIVFVLLFTIVGWYGLILGLVVTMGCEIFNECVIDSKFDWEDFWWTLIGALLSIICILFIKLI